jgi:phospholipid/cholesterol/gamma-HCH transport system permease protein
MVAQTGEIKSGRDGARLIVSLGGRWDIDGAARLDGELRRLSPGPAQQVSIDIAGVEALDTAAASVLYHARKRLRASGLDAEFTRAQPEQSALLDLVEANDVPVACHPPREPPLRAVVAHVGRASVEALQTGLSMVAFFGLTATTLARATIRPWRIRGTALVSHMEQSGLNAVPIVGLISFLIGVVLAYQGATQLSRFGAEIFVVNLVGVSVVREIGILLTAIVIAGRSGSAYTAAIGSMKVREEVDAMRTLGLDPMEVLVLPRVLALVIVLPLLAFFADAMGLLGGGLMAWISLGITPGQFIERLGDAVPMWSFWVGIIKAPVFAFLIAMVGCYEGFQVSGSAESVGSHTTKAVVEAIFLVIVFDAAFSILFAYLGI